MKKLPYRAVITDLDRTLLRTDKSISGYTLEVLKKWRDAGAFLYAATARPERAITEYRELAGFRSATTLNGARTVTPGAVYENTIDPADAAFILEQLVRTEGTVISVETENGIYANTDIPAWTPVVTDDIAALPEHEKIYKILASHPDLPPDRLVAELPDSVYSTVAVGKLLQVMDRKATKWNGIRQMLEYDHISPEEAIFFGDDNDDMEPVTRCGCGVAVGNALDCVKEAADAVTGSNDEDGVAAYLDRILSVKWGEGRKTMLYVKEANTEDMEKEWAFVRDMPADENGMINEWSGVSREDFEEKALPEMLANAEGRGLPAGYVPQTTLFLWENDRIVGLFRIRHYLCESLRTGAGHIGYCIGKEYRGRGFGTQGLRLTLERAREIVPEDEFYLRVDRSNTASLHVMLNNGGRIAAEDEEKYYVRIPNPGKTAPEA